MAEICKLLYEGGEAANSYLFAKEETGAALLIEGCASVLSVKKALKETGCELKAICLTHGHYDHILSLPELISAFSCPVYIAKEDAPCLQAGNPANVAWLFGRQFAGCEANYLPETGELSLDGISLKIHFVPGHTAGGVLYETDNFLFTGDTLLPGSCGRSDLPTGDETALRLSLKKIGALLQKKDPETILCTGHGPVVSVKTELARNMFLK